MKKIAFLISSCVLILAAASSFAGHRGGSRGGNGGSGGTKLIHDITSEIPEMNNADVNGFQKIKDVAQYKNADWSNVIGIAKHVTLDEAFRMAKENPVITFFFYMKGSQMILETTDGRYRVFHQGDAVFFSGQPWWGSAPGYADGYIKKDEKGNMKDED